jgi:hypothetical protein
LSTNLEKKIDGGYLTDKALHQGLAGMVYENFKSLNAEKKVARLQKYYLSTVLFNQSQEKELEKILVKANQKRIPLLLLKGPVLTKLIYKRPGLRWSSDLDLFVRPEDFRRMEEILLSQGFIRSPPKDAAAKFYAQKLAASNDFASTPLYHLSYANKARVTVELHWRFTQPRKALKINQEALWSNTREIKFGQSKMLTFTSEHLLWYLSLALPLKNFFNSRLKKVVDIHELINVFEIDWNELIAIAKQSNSSQYIYASLKLSKEYFGSDVPDKVFMALKPNPFYRLIYALFRQHYLSLEAVPEKAAINFARLFRFLPFSTPF